MDRAGIETQVRELFAAKERWELRRALRKQPLPFLRMIEAGPAEPAQAAAAAPLSEEEIDRRVIGVLRALGEERLTRLLAEARAQPRGA
jgi:hypothetical protein